MIPRVQAQIWLYNQPPFVYPIRILNPAKHGAILISRVPLYPPKTVSAKVALDGQFKVNDGDLNHTNIPPIVKAARPQEATNPIPSNVRARRLFRVAASATLPAAATLIRTEAIAGIAAPV